MEEKRKLVKGVDRGSSTHAIEAAVQQSSTWCNFPDLNCSKTTFAKGLSGHDRRNTLHSAM